MNKTTIGVLMSNLFPKKSPSKALAKENAKMHELIKYMFTIARLSDNKSMLFEQLKHICMGKFWMNVAKILKRQILTPMEFLKHPRVGKWLSFAWHNDKKCTTFFKHSLYFF